MTSPAPETIPAPARSPWALWGTAHLAWGVAIFLSLIFTAQQLPVESSPHLQQMAWPFYFIALAWIVWTGWRSIERGWRLRSPAFFAERLSALDVITDLVLSTLMLVALLRGGESRMLAAGLDRMVSTLLTISTLSAMLWLINRVRLHHPKRPTAAADEVRLRWIRILLGTLLIGLTLIIETIR